MPVSTPGFEVATENFQNHGLDCVQNSSLDLLASIADALAELVEFVRAELVNAFPRIGFFTKQALRSRKKILMNERERRQRKDKKNIVSMMSCKL
jgi:hypothetical protein